MFAVAVCRSEIVSNYSARTASQVFFVSFATTASCAGRSFTAPTRRRSSTPCLQPTVPTNEVHCFPPKSHYRRSFVRRTLAALGFASEVAANQAYQQKSFAPSQRWRNRPENRSFVRLIVFRPFPRVCLSSTQGRPTLIAISRYRSGRRTAIAAKRGTGLPAVIRFRGRDWYESPKFSAFPTPDRTGNRPSSLPFGLRPVQQRRAPVTQSRAEAKREPPPRQFPSRPGDRYQFIVNYIINVGALSMNGNF